MATCWSFPVELIWVIERFFKLCGASSGLGISCLRYPIVITCWLFSWWSLSWSLSASSNYAVLLLVWVSPCLRYPLAARKSHVRQNQTAIALFLVELIGVIECFFKLCGALLVWVSPCLRYSIVILVDCSLVDLILVIVGFFKLCGASTGLGISLLKIPTC